MTTIKNLRNVAHLTNVYNVWAILYSPETNEVAAIELISISEEPRTAEGWHLICKGSGKRTMAVIEEIINAASYQW